MQKRRNITITLNTKQKIDELDQIEAKFHRWTSLFLSILIGTILLSIYTSSIPVYIIAGLTLFMQICTMIFNLIDYIYIGNNNYLLYYKTIQFWVYRIIMSIFLGLFIWAIVDINLLPSVA